jgi:hypothetical protein
MLQARRRSAQAEQHVTMRPRNADPAAPSHRLEPSEAWQKPPAERRDGALDSAPGAPGTPDTLPSPCVDGAPQTARRIVPLVAIVSLWFVFNGEQTLVTLLLFAYAIVTQLFPSVLVSIWWPQRANAVAAFAGIVVGEGLVMYTSLAGITTASMFPSLPASITDMNIGVLALAANVLVLWLLTVLLPTRR